jgi:hypothetical protein
LSIDKIIVFVRYLLGAVLQIDRERHRGQKLFAFSFQQATKAELRDPKGLQLETHPPGRAIASAGWPVPSRAAVSKKSHGN